MSYAITSTKLEETGENILGQPMLFECMGIYVLSSAHESEMRGYLVSGLIVKHFPLILFKFSHSILDWTPLSLNFLGFLETFLEGSVDHVMYRGDIVNRRFLIYLVLPVGIMFLCLCMSRFTDWFLVLHQRPRCLLSCTYFGFPFIHRASMSMKCMCMQDEAK